MAQSECNYTYLKENPALGMSEVKKIPQARCGDHFSVYTNNKPSCCTSETNITLYVNYTSIEIFFKK